MSGRRPRRADESGALIWIDPARMSGAPCIYGTRIPVDVIVDYVAHSGVDEAMVDYELDRRTVVLTCAWWTLNYSAESDAEVVSAWLKWADTAWSSNDPTDPPEVRP